MSKNPALPRLRPALVMEDYNGQAFNWLKLLSFFYGGVHATCGVKAKTTSRNKTRYGTIQKPNIIPCFPEAIYDSYPRAADLPITSTSLETDCSSDLLSSLAT